MKLPWEKLEKLKRPHKLGILVGTLVILGALFYFLLYSPMVAKIEGLNKDITNLIKKNNENRNKIKNAGDIKKRIAALELELKFVSEYLPQKKEVDQLLRQISELGSRAGLNVTLFQPNLKDRVKEFYAEITFQMQVEGPYLSVAQFFYQTAKMKRIVNIEDIKMEKPQLVEGDILLTTSCKGKTFRFLTEAEIAAREQAKKTASKKKK